MGWRKLILSSLLIIHHHRRNTKMSPPYFRQLIFILIMGFSTHMVLSQSLVEYLPGFPGKLPFKLETGYIGVGESEEIQLFYYFIESERSPQNDPLIIRLQGGPGCSAAFSLFFEIGPLKFDLANNKSGIPALVPNPYSWTKMSNILFLDQPVGAGFSYTESPDAYNTNDTLSAKLTYDFLKKWIINHPKYQKNPLYIAGVSYGGIVVPLIVDQVYQGIKAGSEPRLNMKGYILGNPVTDFFVELNGRVPYAHRMGLLSDELYESAKKNCNGSYLFPGNALCMNDVKRVMQCVEKIRPNFILEQWCDMDDGEKRGSPPQVEINPRRFPQSAISPHPNSWCRPMDYLYLYDWANAKLVQKALHVRQGIVTEWTRCNRTLERESYTRDVTSTVNYHNKFADQTNIRALIYSGDHDMVAPHTATRDWIRSLKLPIKSNWRPWFVEGQVAGYTTTWFNKDYDLTHVTVKGAGHTTTDYKPQECLSLIDRWLSHNPL